MEQEEWGQKTNAANREGAAAADRELELHQHNNKKFQVLCVLIFKNLHPLTRVLHEMIDSNEDFFFGLFELYNILLFPLQKQSCSSSNCVPKAEH